MKTTALGFVIMLSLSMTIHAQCPETFYDFSGRDINGNEIEFNVFTGKKILVVNTASF